MNNEQFLASLSFEFLGPDAPRDDGRRFVVARDGRRPARLLELPNSPVDAFNTRLPVEDERTRRTLVELCEIPRMSTFAIAALIDHAVRGMPDGHAFLNVGVWAGFTFLSGVARNPGRRCIGVDDFSGFGGPREGFTTRFEKLASSEHSFFEMDYQRYFAEVHREPLGVYMYDGDHAYEHQLQGLEVAERFFGPRCLVLVDDTNRDEPRQGTLDFIRKSKREYRVLLDCRTADSAHPTFWDGLIVLEATGAARSGPAGGSLAAGQAPPAANAGLSGKGGSSVSIVIVDEGADRDQLEVAHGAARAQTWPDCEAVVTDRAGIRNAIATTNGDYIAFAGATTPLRETAVHMGLEFPIESQFFRRLGGPRYREHEASLPRLERR